MELNKIGWLERFTVGHKGIDTQHKLLITLYNILIDASREDEITTTLLEETVCQLVDYTKYHFTYEENLFSKYNYPDSESHIKEHMSFINKVTDLQNVKTKDLYYELIEFLNHWIINHVTVCDKKYSNFFQNNEV